MTDPRSTRAVHLAQAIDEAERVIMRVEDVVLRISWNAGELDRVFDALEGKSIDSAVARYRKSLRAITRSYFSGDAKRADFEQAVGDAIRVDAEFAFDEGLKEGGAGIDEISEQEQSYLDDWIANQLGFVGGLGDALEAAKGDKAAQKSFYTRLDMWVDSMNTLAMTGRGFASADQMGQWQFGATEQHCSTCEKLAGGPPHRVSWFLKRGYIPRENGSDTLECKGFKCDCSIVGVKSGDRLL